MTIARASERPFDIGAWRVAPAEGLVTAAAAGLSRRLEPRLMDLLVFLAASTGRVVSKDEVIAAVWGGRSVGDDTVASAVSRLRAALAIGGEPSLIETLPKRGYRLSAPIADVAATPAVTRSGPAEAVDLVRQGEAALRAPYGPAITQARLLFEAAIARAPSFAPAHAGLAEALLAPIFRGQAGSASAARAAAHAAIGLDPGLATGWLALGTALLLADRDFAVADEALRRAVALRDNAEARLRRAQAFASVGRMAEAEREARLAVEREPLNLAARAGLLQTLLGARRFRQALAAAAELVELSPASAEAWYAKGWALTWLGEIEDGFEAHMEGLKLWGLDKPGREVIAAAFKAEGVAGGCAAAADLFASQRLLFTPRATDIAFLRAAAGQADEAFAALEMARERDDPTLLMLPWLPHIDPLRGDPRFGALLSRLRLVS
ncbi:MAG TPA: winged helix-turn-helix domain-containing protein [Caulobacteraceae bacterium]|nr:winged helix-turn-helix domain-containing protein [Caulobacteraceae bacterium]